MKGFQAWVAWQQCRHLESIEGSIQESFCDFQLA